MPQPLTKPAKHSQGSSIIVGRNAFRDVYGEQYFSLDFNGNSTLCGHHYGQRCVTHQALKQCGF